MTDNLQNKLKEASAQSQALAAKTNKVISIQQLMESKYKLQKTQQHHEPQKASNTAAAVPDLDSEATMGSASSLSPLRA